MLKFLPEKIKNALSYLDIACLYEIRLRCNRPITVSYNMQTAYLSVDGITIERKKAIFVSDAELNDIVMNICDRSLYSFTDKLKRGFITIEQGVRIGICGECVVSGNEVINVKNISSLNIRIPHYVSGCSNEIFKYYKNRILNTLIVSPPCSGKTTMVRDLAESISKKKFLNVLVSDERNEIFPLISSSDTIDCVVYSSKEHALENSVRAMAPDVIVTDEIYGNNDVLALSRACAGGVKVIATAHGEQPEDLKCFENYVNLKKIFELFVFLDESRGKGTVRKIYTREEMGFL